MSELRVDARFCEPHIMSIPAAFLAKWERATSNEDLQRVWQQIEDDFVFEQRIEVTPAGAAALKLAVTHNEDRVPGIRCAACGTRARILVHVDGRYWCKRHRPKAMTTNQMNGGKVWNETDDSELPFSDDDRDGEAP